MSSCIPNDQYTFLIIQFSKTTGDSELVWVTTHLYKINSMMTFFIRMIIFLIFNSHSPSSSYETYCTRKIIIYSGWFSWIINKVFRIELTSSLFRLLFAFKTWRFELQPSCIRSSISLYGDSDVGDIAMLVTLWWWLIWNVGDRIIMLATFFSCSCFFNVTNTFGPQQQSPT